MAGKKRVSTFAEAQINIISKRWKLIIKKQFHLKTANVIVKQKKRSSLSKSKVQL